MSINKKIFLAVFAVFIAGLNVASYYWVQFLKVEEVTYLKDEYVLDFTFDNQDRLWALVSPKLGEYDYGDIEFRVYENGVITHVYTDVEMGNRFSPRDLQDIHDLIVVDSTGRAWINLGQRVVVVDGEKLRGVPLDFTEPIFLITTIAIDTQGKLWVGTQDGLFVVDGNKLKNYTEDNSDLLGNIVTGIAFDNQGRAWITSYNYDDIGGVNIFDGKSWQSWTPENSPLLSEKVSSIIFDKQNRAWIGTDKEIAFFDGKDWVSYLTNKVVMVHEEVDSMVFDDAGRMWVNRTRVFDGKTWKYYLDPYHLGVNDTAVDNDGNVWVATDNGVVIIRPGSPQPVSYAIALIAIAIASDILIYITLLFLIVWVSVAYNTWNSIGYSLLSLPVYLIWINIFRGNFYSSAVFWGLGGDNSFILNPAMFGAIGGIIGGATEIYFKRNGSTNTKRWGLIGFVVGTVFSFCVLILPGYLYPGT